jgi:hypothetical protein
VVRVLPLILLAIGSLSLAAAPAGQEAQDKAAPESRPQKYPSFYDAEVRIMEDFYRPGSGHILPGLAKKPPELPAGAAKQAHRGGVLPAGSEKKLEPLPKDLERRLAPVPDGYHRYIAGTVALLVQDGSNLVVDAADLRRSATP